MDVKLVMFRNDGQRKDFPVVSSPVTIGRGEGCELRVPLLSVSRRHCQITVENDQVIVKDLGSSNGTFVNNKRVTEQQLRPGDRVVIGPVIFTVQIDGQPEEIRPARTKVRKPAQEAPAAETVGVGQTDEDTGAPVAGEEEVDPIAALEDLVAEALKEEEEEEGDSTASRA
ncbi:MAG: FHA domain-containing protein [Phycisphaerae bacterium]|nr:FHA domain-containing protein [Phycisphaerae bacterium]